MMPIERMRPEDFDAVFRLLARSFPAGERRDKAGQRALLADSAYHIDILRPPSCARSRRLCTRACTVKRPPRWYNRKQKVSTPLHGRGRGVPFSIWREKQCRIIVRGGRLCRRP